MKRLLGFTQSDFDPAARFRFIQLIPHLQKAGWEVDHRPNRPDRQWNSSLKPAALRGLHYRLGRGVMKCNRLRDVRAAGQFDAVFMNRDLAGTGSYFEKRLHRRNPRILYDFDDAIFVGPNESAVAWICAHAAWVTPGNEYLASFARKHTDRVTVIPTIIDTDLCRPRSYATAPIPRRVRVGWSGSNQSVGATLVPQLPTLTKLQAKLDFELVVISNHKPAIDLPGLRWSFFPWRSEDEATLGDKFDIGIMPLQDDSFQKGKCGLKLLQYMAAGLATVGSPVGVNDDIIVDGTTGLKARNEAEWHTTLETLIRSPEQCAAMGQAGRTRCEQEYSIRRWLPVFLEILERIRQ